MAQESRYRETIELLAEKVDRAQAVVVGTGSALKAASGLGFYRQRDEVFAKRFAPFAQAYGFGTVEQGLGDISGTSEVRWAFLAAHYAELADRPAPQVYLDLAALLEGKRYHIVTVNQDFQLSKVFDDENVSTIQGDYRYLQCFHRCHDELYPAEPVYRGLLDATENCRVPSDDVPRCPKCGTELEPWIGGYSFLEGEQYKAEYGKWEDFILSCQEEDTLFFEIGVGRKRKELIRQPFWQFAFSWREAFYVNLNPDNALVPMELEARGLAAEYDIARVLSDVRAQLGR